MTMNGEAENDTLNLEDTSSIAGDVIRDTAYSERFVLKILLKLANRDTLKHELMEPSFEDELCTLWDMTAERDVVLYLQKHDALNLFTFAAPLITSDRIYEIVVGTIANMCCQKEAVDDLMNKEDLLELLFKLFSQEDSQIFIQLIRLINSCIYVADARQLSVWMKKFSEYGYATTIYFILKNSLNKDLLMTALENLNTICDNCQTEQLCSEFKTMFITEDALQSVYVAHCEYRKQANLGVDLERLHIITLQMMLHLTKVEVVIEDEKKVITFDNSEYAINLLQDILVSYESRTAEYTVIDTEILNVLDAANVFIKYLESSSLSSPDKYFTPSYNIWKSLIPHTEKDEALTDLIDHIKNNLASIMCIYLANCTDDNLLEALDDIGDEYKKIVGQISDAELQAAIRNRSLNYRNRLNESIDS